MHSLSHIAYAHAVADERLRSAAPRAIPRVRKHRPPPSRRGIARAARIVRRPAA